MVTKSLKQVHNLLNHMPSEKGCITGWYLLLILTNIFFVVSAGRNMVNLISNLSNGYPLKPIDIFVHYPCEILFYKMEVF